MNGENSTATGTTTQAEASPMTAARAIPQREQLGAGKAKRPQGRQIGRVQVGLPGQRLPHDGKRRKPDENAKRPQRMRLQPDRPLDPGGLHLPHFGDVDAAQARGPHLADERLPACGAVAEPDQQ